MQPNELQTLVHDPLQCWFDIMWMDLLFPQQNIVFKIAHKIRLQAQVRLPDGQQRTFDASSVKKMIESPEKEVSEFLGSRFSTASVKSLDLRSPRFLENLSHTELRGLVHEAWQF